MANMIFIGAVNHAGPDDQRPYFGGTIAYNPRGEVIGKASQNGDELVVIDCGLDLIDEMRQIYPFFRDRRPETYGPLCR